MSSKKSLLPEVTEENTAEAGEALVPASNLNVAVALPAASFVPVPAVNPQGPVSTRQLNSLPDGAEYPKEPVAATPSAKAIAATRIKA